MIISEYSAYRWKIWDSSATFTLSFETNFVLGLQKMLADLIWWGFLPRLGLQYPGNSTNASVLQYYEESFIATKCYLKMRLYAPEIHVIENLIIIIIIISFIRSLFEELWCKKELIANFWCCQDSVFFFFCCKYSTPFRFVVRGKMVCLVFQSE